MALFAKAISFFFLLVLISPLQIQAREREFFSKFIHISTKSTAIPESQISQSPTAAPALAPTPEAEPTITAEPVSAPSAAPTLFYAVSENGNGVYGHGSDQFPLAKETLTSTTGENDLLNEELSAENFETGYQNSNYNNNAYTNNYNYNGYVTEKQGMSDNRFMQNYQNSMNGNTNNNNHYYNNNAYSNNYNNNGYNLNYNNNGYVTEKQGMSDTGFMQNYQNSNDNNEYATTATNNNNAFSNNYNNNGYTSNTGYMGNYYNNGYSSSYNTNGYETEKKGMSDTRFLENGKYYYDAKNENNYYPNGFESEKGTATNEAYYGHSQNANEFNTMDEYENQQEYHENPEKYVP